VPKTASTDLLRVITTFWTGLDDSQVAQPGMELPAFDGTAVSVTVWPRS